MTTKISITTNEAASAGQDNLLNRRRFHLAIPVELYLDIMKIAYMERRSMSEVICEAVTEYRNKHILDLEKYNLIFERTLQ